MLSSRNLPLLQAPVNDTSWGGLLLTPPQSSGKRGGGQGASWYEAMAQAWGQVMDGQAARVTSASDAIAGGNDSPSAMVTLTAEAQKLAFMAQNASSSVNATADALETLATKK
jgi:hypothetical protein